MGIGEPLSHLVDSEPLVARLELLLGAGDRPLVIVDAVVAVWLLEFKLS